MSTLSQIKGGSLVAGDLAALIAGLWLSLWLRYGAWPTQLLFLQNLGPFIFVFAAWLIVFFIFDLYRPKIAIWRHEFVATLLKAYAVNTLVAVVFFYFVPAFAIAPKRVLFLELIIGGLLLWWWRRFIVARLNVRRVEKFFFVGNGAAVAELKKQLTTHRSYGATVVDQLPSIEQAHDLTIVLPPRQGGASQIVGGEWSKYLFSGARFITAIALYEEVFSRVPIELINEEWCLEHLSGHPKPVYDFLKRLMDIVISLPLFIISLVLYPIVYLLIKLDDGGPLFIYQDRVGLNQKQMTMFKFRSMYVKSDLDVTRDSVSRVMRVGNFLRQTRIDEIPQLLSVLKGDQSLIGPRPELPDLVKLYEAQIPFYALRHIIKPGLSGWAQMYHDQHPHHGVDVAETAQKLSYDLYYVKNRSVALDLEIAIKTVRKLLSIAGS